MVSFRRFGVRSPVKKKQKRGKISDTPIYRSTRLGEVQGYSPEGERGSNPVEKEGVPPYTAEPVYSRHKGMA